jgi:hypothetical protein
MRADEGRVEMCTRANPGAFNLPRTAEQETNSMRLMEPSSSLASLLRSLDHPGVRHPLRDLQLLQKHHPGSLLKLRTLLVLFSASNR